MSAQDMIFIFIKAPTKHRSGMNSKGWCGVCLKDATYGGNGHCALDEVTSKDKEHATRVESSKNWGFCSDHCKTGSWGQPLKETKLTVLPSKDCAIFDPSVRSEAELCAGKKTPYPTMKVFTRKKLRKISPSGKKYIFIYKEDEINTVRGHPHMISYFWIGRFLKIGYYQSKIGFTLGKI